MRLHITTADFGKENPISKITLPEQINNVHEITTSCYNDLNTNNSRRNSLHVRTKSKIPKMLEWMKVSADYYIWMDSNFEIISNNFADSIIKYIGENLICLYNHPWNKTIQQELESIEKQIEKQNVYHISRYCGEPLREQVNSYLSDNTFIDDSLFSLGFFIYSRKIVENTNYNILTDWFFHSCYWSIQDQLSFPYLLKKHKVKFSTFNEGNIYSNQFVKYKGY